MPQSLPSAPVLLVPVALLPVSPLSAWPAHGTLQLFCYPSGSMTEVSFLSGPPSLLLMVVYTWTLKVDLRAAGVRRSRVSAGLLFSLNCLLELVFN